MFITDVDEADEAEEQMVLVVLVMLTVSMVDETVGETEDVADRRADEAVDVPVVVLLEEVVLVTSPASLAVIWKGYEYWNTDVSESRLIRMP